MTRLVTEAQAEKAIDGMHTRLKEPLSDAIKDARALLHDLGSRDVNVVYLHDDLNSVLVLAQLLDKSLNSLVQAIGTVRWPVNDG